MDNGYSVCRGVQTNGQEFKLMKLYIIVIKKNIRDLKKEKPVLEVLLLHVLQLS